MTINTYKMLIPAVPFPFEGKVKATNLQAAIAKVKFQAKILGIKTFGKPFEIEILEKKEI